MEICFSVRRPIVIFVNHHNYDANTIVKQYLVFETYAQATPATISTQPDWNGNYDFDTITTIRFANQRNNAEDFKPGTDMIVALKARVSFDL